MRFKQEHNMVKSGSKSEEFEDDENVIVVESKF